MRAVFNILKGVAIALILDVSVSYAAADAGNKYNPNDARYCVTAIKYYERVYGIPNNLLYAISVVESGRWNDLYNSTVPWPWSVNVEGESFYFATKADATKFIKHKLAQGITKMDVGCNQINVYHHGYNFKDVEDMLNPVRNVQYAAQFLHGHYTSTKNWAKAVAWYHSKTVELGDAYVKRVKSALSKNLQNMHLLHPVMPVQQHRAVYSTSSYDNAYHISKYSSQKQPKVVRVSAGSQKNYKALNNITKKVLRACE